MRSRLIAALLACCAGAPLFAAIGDRSGVPQVRIEVSRRGDDWRAQFTFDRPLAAWVFPRSAYTVENPHPWRPGSWSIDTRGVRLQRRGNYDVLEADRGELPLQVNVRFRPVRDRLQGDYAPALVFSEGSVALHVAQFDGFPLDKASEARKLPSDLNNQLVPSAEVKFAFRDAAGPVLLDGKRSALAETSSPDTYALFGALRSIETPDLVALLDPQLPEWIKDSLSTVPRLLSRYTQELGPLKEFKPTLMVSWAGATPGIVSRGGSVLRGLIVMTYEGSGMLQETPEQRRQGLWFIAHEAAHFWLGQTVSYEYARDAWITEGGADLLAIRAVAEADPEYDATVELNRAVDDCIKLTRRRGVASARERNEHRAYYACGALFGLAAEAGTGRSFFKFVRGVIDANRADGVVTRADWLAALDSATRKPLLRRDIERLLDRGASDPAAAIADLFTHSGVAFEQDSSGIPRLR